MLNKRLLLCLVIPLLILFTSCVFGENDNDKIKIFYKYDSLFFMGDKDKYLDVEIGDPELITDINGLSEEYGDIVKNYLIEITSFVNKNLLFIKKFCNDSFKDLPEEYFLEQDKLFIENIEKNLLQNLKSSIRCMFAIYDIQYLEVAKKLKNDEAAKTIFHNDIDSVYWINILYGEYPYEDLKKKHTDKQGKMKYDHWFYESNMKIRIVKQVRDEIGNYLGEIYVDFYKLDKYNELFDKKGNPKVKK